MEDEADRPAAPGLRADVTRGQALDRELSRALGRPRPARAAVAESWFSGLGDPAPGAADEERLVRAAQAGDPAARSALVAACLPRIAAASRTYRSGQVQRAELLQEGVVGLLRALERYDPDRGVPFWGYATWWVRQAMQQLVAELTRPVVLSDRALRNLARLKELHREALAHAEGEPGAALLAERSGLPLEQVADLLATEGPARSLHEPAGAGDVGTFGELLADPLAEDAYEEVLGALEAEDLHALLGGLSDRERAILRARYGLDGPERSLREVAEELGLSRERVRQLEERALAKLASGFQGAGA